MMKEGSYQEELSRINEFVHFSLELGVNENRIANVLEANGFRRTKYGGLRYFSDTVRMEYDLQSRVPLSVKIKKDASNLESKSVLSAILKDLQRT